MYKIKEKYRCMVCSYVYDPARGDMEHGIYQDTDFEYLPPRWDCPQCHSNKEVFIKS